MFRKKLTKNEMSGRVNLELAMGDCGSPLLELFEACKMGELQKVKQLRFRDFVNSRDKEGRKSTCLHFAAGEFLRNIFFKAPVCLAIIMESPSLLYVAQNSIQFKRLVMIL